MNRALLGRYISKGVFLPILRQPPEGFLNNRIDQSQQPKKKEKIKKALQSTLDNSI
jgi:hypothetical protein